VGGVPGALLHRKVSATKVGSRARRDVIPSTPTRQNSVRVGYMHRVRLIAALNLGGRRRRERVRGVSEDAVMHFSSGGTASLARTRVVLPAPDAPNTTSTAGGDATTISLSGMKWS
jgi:hypothetical protein